jgi:hypothetical protein
LHEQDANQHYTHYTVETNNLKYGLKHNLTTCGLKNTQNNIYWYQTMMLWLQSQTFNWHQLDANWKHYLRFPTHPCKATCCHSPEVGISKARLPRESRSVGDTCCPSCNCCCCCRAPWPWLPPPPDCCCVRAPTTARNSCRTNSDDIPLLPPGRQHIYSKKLQ